MLLCVFYGVPRPLTLTVVVGFHDMLTVRFGDENGGILCFSKGVLKCPVVQSRSNSARFHLYILGSWKGAFHFVIDQDDPAWGHHITWGFLKFAFSTLKMTC